METRGEERIQGDEIQRMNGCILAGGKNSRMNYRIKALLKYRGETFLERALKVLEELDRFIVTNNREVSEGVEIPAYSDIVKDIGPMGGVYTALKVSSSESCMVIGCDMPFVTRELIGKIISYKGYDVVVPRIEGQVELLCAMYSKRCIPVIEDLIEKKKYKLTLILERVRVKYVDLSRDELDYFVNINTPEDYEKII